MKLGQFGDMLEDGGEDSPAVQGMLAEYPEETPLGMQLRIVLNVWLRRP